MRDIILIVNIAVQFSIISFMVIDFRADVKQNHAELIEILNDPLYQHCRVREQLQKGRDDD
jgi:hypothetical protein